jgi:hypothetical protein
VHQGRSRCDELTLIPDYAVGNSHARRLPSVLPGAMTQIVQWQNGESNPNRTVQAAPKFQNVWSLHGGIGAGSGGLGQGVAYARATKYQHQVGVRVRVFVCAKAHTQGELTHYARVSLSPVSFMVGLTVVEGGGGQR